MLVEEHFSLRLTRIKPTEEWSNQREGFVFLMFRAGSGSFNSDKQTLPTGPGDLLILTNGSKGKLRPMTGNELVFWNFSLCLEHLFPLFASNEIALLEDVVGGLESAKMVPAASPLAGQVTRLIEQVPAEYSLEHRSQLLRVAAAILTEEFKTARQRRAGFVRTEDRIVQVFEKLSTDELLDLSIDELAAKFGCSRRHLNRLSHQYLGRSIAALKMESRLMKAAACLRNPDAKIINVAEQCGFNHLGLFNSCFKKRFGACPGKWRKLKADQMASLTAGGNLAVPSDDPGSAKISLHFPNQLGETTHSFPVSARIQPDRAIKNGLKKTSKSKNDPADRQKVNAGRNSKKHHGMGRKTKDHKLLESGSESR